MAKSMLKELRNNIKENKSTFVVYVILRVIVIAVIVAVVVAVIILVIVVLPATVAAASFKSVPCALVTVIAGGVQAIGATVAVLVCAALAATISVPMT